MPDLNDSQSKKPMEVGTPPPEQQLEQLSAGDRRRLIERLLRDPEGRRWLRRSALLNEELACRLLAVKADFKGNMQDRSLDAVIRVAAFSDLRQHALAIAAGPAAPTLWERLAKTPSQLTSVAVDVVQASSPEASRSTLYLLLLDEFDPYGLARVHQERIAEAALTSTDTTTRGLAVEFLANNCPQALLAKLEDLSNDESERVRGFSWRAGFQMDADRATELAFTTLVPESAPPQLQRSALLAASEHLRTEEISGILAYFVSHPDPDLAVDAARLMFRLHRSPDIASAAMASPHEDVRSIAAALLDPYRGSPAAGGSRPGDPSTIDLVIDLMRAAETGVPDDEDSELPG